MTPLIKEGMLPAEAQVSANRPKMTICPTRTVQNFLRERLACLNGFRNDLKGGVEFKRGSLHDGFSGFDGFVGSGKHLALLSLALQNTGQRGNRERFGRDGYPP